MWCGFAKDKWSGQDDLTAPFVFTEIFTEFIPLIKLFLSDCSLGQYICLWCSFG